MNDARRANADPRTHYSPILDKEVPVDMLDVRIVNGFASNENGTGTTTNTDAAYDIDGNLLQLLATDDLSVLVDLIPKPGRYRILARDPRTKRIITSRDELLRPRPGRRALPEIDPAVLYPKARKGDESRVERLLEGQVEVLQAANKAQQTTIDTLQTEVRDRSIEAAEAKARVEGLTERLGDLEAQRDELREKLTLVQAMLERAEAQLKDASVSPLEALGGISEGVSLIKQTVREFSTD